MPTAVKTNQGDEMIPHGKALIDYEDALAQLTEEDRLRPTVYAIEHASSRQGRLHRARI